MWLLVLIGLLALDGHALAPVQIWWEGLSARRFFIAPTALPGGASVPNGASVQPQAPMIRAASSRMFADETPHFVLTSDKTISWTDAGSGTSWCVEASNHGVIAGHCTATANQLWNVLSWDHGRIQQIQLDGTRSCLHVNDHKVALDGARVELAECGDRATGFWKFEELPLPTQRSLQHFVRHSSTQLGSFLFVFCAGFVALSLSVLWWGKASRCPAGTNQNGAILNIDLGGVCLAEPLAECQSHVTMPARFEGKEENIVSAVMTVAAAEAPSLASLKVYELKAICKAKGLKVSGRKAELVLRIEEAAESMSIRQDAQHQAPENVVSKPVLDDEQALSVPHDVGSTKYSDFATSEASRSPVNHTTFVSPSTVTEASGVEVEVLTAEDAEEEDVASRRAARLAGRRARLAGYFSEEYKKVTGELQSVAGPSYAASLGNPELESISILGVPLQYALPATKKPPVIEASKQGGRFAWCKTFNSTTGTGVLIDLEDKTEVNVNRLALTISVDMPFAQRNLHPGEFVEYDPIAAKSYSAGTVTTTPWVCGVKSWPLMCETCLGLGLNGPFPPFQPCG